MEKEHNWNNLGNMLLVHGLNFNGQTKGNYKKNFENPLPKNGELACSIISPLTQIAYASEGLILKPTKPNRFSYIDVGSYYEKESDVSGLRKVKGQMWTPEEICFNELMILTLANGGYNEVLIPAENTKIEGIYGREKSVDDFVNQNISFVLSKNSEEKYLDFVKTKCNAALGADYYVHRERKLDEAWKISDKTSNEINNQGYELGKKFGEYQRLIQDMLENKINLKNLERNEILGGQFIKQTINSDHKKKLRKFLDKN
jgi:hypothetical protein